MEFCRDKEISFFARAYGVRSVCLSLPLREVNPTTIHNSQAAYPNVKNSSALSRISSAPDASLYACGWRGEQPWTTINRLNPIFFIALATEPMFSGNPGLTKRIEMESRRTFLLMGFIIPPPSPPPQGGGLGRGRHALNIFLIAAITRAISPGTV